MKTKIVQRTFIIGDKWLYYKIYMGHKTSDQVLTELLKPLVEELLKENLIEKWFFIRYDDPKHHLRFRFLCKDNEKVGIIINTLSEGMGWYIENDLIWKVHVDTYERELERYGYYNIENTEDYFHLDSTMILELLDLIEGGEGEQLRWLFGIKAIDSLLDVFNYSDVDKLKLLEQLKLLFGAEFNMSRPLKKQLDSKFRKENNKILSFLNPKNGLGNDRKQLYEIIERKEKRTKGIADNILLLKNKNKLEIQLDDLMSSYIHMLMNRLFRSDNRLHEMVIYDFLFRIYKSKNARKKYEKQCVN